MPNGGSDCCGTCWFNSANEGNPGYQKPDADVQVRCVIRDVDIEVPFWTYCANHPHHNPERIDLPIGSIYVDSGEGFPYQRKTLLESPDSEDIRVKLLELLRSIEEMPREEYPTSTKLDETVILQLGLFRERRAIDDLRRMLSFDPFASPAGDNPLGRNRISTIARAIESLAHILHDDALPEIERCLKLGLDAAKQLSEYNFADDRLATIRYWAVKSLESCSSSRIQELLVLAQDDPNPDVAAIAKEVCTRNDG
jgi:hypothetical protein